MKPSRRLTPIALAPLLVFAGSKYQPIQSPESYSVGTIEGAQPNRPSFRNVRGLLRDRNFNLHQGAVYFEQALSCQ